MQIAMKPVLSQAVRMPALRNKVAMPHLGSSNRRLSRKPAVTCAASSSEPQEVYAAADAAKLVNEHGYKYVDVRNPDEFAAGRVPKAVNIPITSPDFFQQFKQAFPSSDERIVVACKSGARSTMATEQLKAMYPRLVNFKGSWLAWTEAGMPVEM